MNLLIICILYMGIIFLALREWHVAPVFEVIDGCENTIHHLNNFCSISQHNPYFMDCFKAEQELERRRKATAKICEAKTSRFMHFLMTPTEKRRYEEFMNKIPGVKAELERADARYTEFKRTCGMYN